MSKNCQKLDIFSKKLTMAILLKKMTIFVNFFEKNVKFLAIFGQSNGNFPEGQVITCLCARTYNRHNAHNASVKCVRAWTVSELKMCPDLRALKRISVKYVRIFERYNTSVKYVRIWTVSVIEICPDLRATQRVSCRICPDSRAWRSRDNGGK